MFLVASGLFLNNFYEWRSHRYARQPMYYFISYRLFWWQNTDKSMTIPLLFTMGQSVVVLWRHANTYYDVFLIDSSPNV